MGDRLLDHSACKREPRPKHNPDCNPDREQHRPSLRNSKDSAVTYRENQDFSRTSQKFSHLSLRDKGFEINLIPTHLLTTEIALVLHKTTELKN